MFRGMRLGQTLLTSHAAATVSNPLGVREALLTSVLRPTPFVMLLVALENLESHSRSRITHDRTPPRSTATEDLRAASTYAWFKPGNRWFRAPRAKLLANTVRGLDCTHLLRSSSSNFAVSPKSCTISGSSIAERILNRVPEPCECKLLARP